jgi:hypothetical protein
MGNRSSSKRNLSTPKQNASMIERLPQELLITTLSYLLVKDINSCSFMNKQWYEMIHGQLSSSSQEIWKNLCQTTFSGSIELQLHNIDHKTWKQVYKLTKVACSLKFVQHSKLQKISFLNNNGTIHNEFNIWQTLAINKLINLYDYKNKPGKFCFDIVLDDFNPQQTPTNYYCVIIGVIWTNVMDKIDVLSFSNNTVAYYSGNRRVFKLSKGYNFTDAIENNVFPDNMIKNGDVVRVELSLHNGTFDIDFYVNGELQEPQDSSDKIHFKDMPAYSIQPYVSLIGKNKLTVRRSFHD